MESAPLWNDGIPNPWRQDCRSDGMLISLSRPGLFAHRLERGFSYAFRKVNPRFSVQAIE